MSIPVAPEAAEYYPHAADLTGGTLPGWAPFHVREREDGVIASS